MTEDNAFSRRQGKPADRPLRLISSGEGHPLPASPPSQLQPPSPALRRLQQDLEAARAEARSLRDILEELPAILERKFQQRLRTLLGEHQQLEQDNALLRQHLLAVQGAQGTHGDRLPVLAPAPTPSRPEPEQDEWADGPITAGLGLRRALRCLHR
jgi:hypothetical protein